MKIKGAIFDMDGTVIDSLWVWDYLWEELGKKYLGKEGFRPSAEDDRAVRTMILKDVAAFIAEGYSMGDAEEVFKTTEQVIERFYRERVEPKKDVIGLLDRMKSEGVRMCVASATARELLSIAIRRCDLGKYFEAVVSCADVGKGKDCPDVFMEALRVLGTPLDETAVFEDSALAAETSKRAGFFVVGVYDPDNYGQERLMKNSDRYIDRDGLFSQVYDII